MHRFSAQTGARVVGRGSSVRLQKFHRLFSAVAWPQVAWVYHPDYAVLDGWDSGHRFNMAKYPELYKSLVRSGVVNPSMVHEPEDPESNDWLHVAHCPTFVETYCNGSLNAAGLRRIGLPWSPEMVHAIRLEVAGTVLAARLALEAGLACNLGGGTHHAHFSHGGGFNVFNDLALAALTVLQEGLVDNVLIVDLDVHQGDGTAAILADNPQVKTFSMHASKCFPLRKHPSTVDVGLPNGVDDEEFMTLLETHLIRLLDNQPRPSLVLFDAGVDVHERDGVRGFCRGHLLLTDNGLRRRDDFVFRECISRGIPVASVIGGGYSSDLGELIQRHSVHAEVAAKIAVGTYHSQHEHDGARSSDLHRLERSVCATS